MLLRLYRGDHRWLVVPDCMQASRAAAARFGTLRLVAEVDRNRFSGAEWALISAGFDAESFAEVPEDTARRVLPGVGA